VTELRRVGDIFEVRTTNQTLSARQVVVATGPFQVHFIPPAASKLDPSVTQVHSADYRNTRALPDGPVLVVGGGNSGFQIAEELAATRQVDLSIGARAPMLPQRLLGKDLFWWLIRLGVMRVCRSTPGSAGGQANASSSSGPAGARSREQESGSGPGWPKPTAAPSGSATTAPWKTSGSWSGRPATAYLADRIAARHQAAMSANAGTTQQPSS
jgi:hypothetical protein